MTTQTQLNISQPIDSVESYEFEPIQGYPMLNWKGKRPFRATQYYPAQLKEAHGEETDGWRNKLYWGDNLQVMSHLLKTYRGQIALIYIDPPFDSKAEYKKKIQLRGNTVENDQSAFEEKQYTDIWINDEYLQFMYERLILMRELLADSGSILVHCDARKSHHLRCLLDEVFGSDNFINEIIWMHTVLGGAHGRALPKSHETIFWYGKSPNYFFNKDAKSARVPFGDYIRKTLRQDEEGRWYYTRGRMSREPSAEEAITNPFTRTYVDNPEAGTVASDLWSDKPAYRVYGKENTGYPTQKNESIIERCVELGTSTGDIVFDCFMGSGTTQRVAMKLGHRFIGADINLSAVQITTKECLKTANNIQENTTQQKMDIQDNAPQTFYTGFEVYNVNHYDVFRNPVQAKDLLIEALEIQPLRTSELYDGEKDGRMVKIMPVNRIATRADLNELITGFDYRAFEKRHGEHPTAPVENLLLICMGHDPDLAAALQTEVPYKLDIEVVDILRDKSNLEFKRDSEAKIVRRGGRLIIERFYPMNLLQKLSLMKENVEDWRELVESVMIDFNYDGAVLSPSVVDLPEEDELVKGVYPIPENAGTIRVKLTDLLSESLEVEVEHG